MIHIRKETESLGEVAVPADKLWAAQTQRSLEDFRIGQDRIPRERITAYATRKKAAANANLTGTANAIRAFAPHLVKRGGGRIIVTGSTQDRHGMKNGSAYSASKWGIIDNRIRPPDGDRTTQHSGAAKFCR